MINKLVNSRVCHLKPKWFLRQAGRHIADYHLIRDKHKSFIDFCLEENSIVEATLLPLKYYNIDAAILFSDILIIPHCLGQKVKFKKNLGPLLQNIEINKNFLEKDINFNDLAPIKNALIKVRKTIPSTKDLIGFCGAPWTLACYMLEGSSSKDYVKTRRFLWNDEKTFIKLINKLINHCAEFLQFQYLAGATVLMIFDSWANMIPDRYTVKFGIDPIRSIVNKLRENGIKCPIIGLPFKSGEMLVQYSYESLVDVVSIDWKTNLEWALKNINNKIVTQGNLDPVLLSSNNLSAIKNEVYRILDITQKKRHIFNVGHGLIPEVKVSNVKYTIDIIDNY